jgi:hypothetical protein
MTERSRKSAGSASAVAAPDGQMQEETSSGAEAADGAEAERLLGRIVAIAIPVVSVVAAIAVGFAASVGSGLLVLASGALLGTIALLWASVRTLSGDAPLPADLEALAAQRRDVDALGEEKRRVLRALKDLEGEHAIGKIDDADYEAIARQYREDAKTLMREMDRNAAPALAEAERIAREYLARQGLGEAGKAAEKGPVKPAAAVTRDSEVAPRTRMACPACATSNEPDAAFCKKCGASMKAAKPSAEAATEENDATS